MGNRTHSSIVNMRALFLAFCTPHVYGVPTEVRSTSAPQQHHNRI